MKIKKPKARVTWEFNPVSRVVPSKKIYQHASEKAVLYMTNATRMEKNEY